MKKLLNYSIIVLTALLASCSGRSTNTGAGDDPFLWLEDITGDRSLEWVKAQNKLTDDAFSGAPLYSEFSRRFAEVLNDREQLIYPDMVGNTVFNLWQDDKNERGLWRRMSKDAFIKGSNEWETVLDLDRLSSEEGKMWVFHGADWLGPDNRICLLTVSDGGKDEAVTREFDASSKSFVTDGFIIPESKGSSAWVDQNTIVVATNYGPGSMTTSGYPRIAKLWRRGGQPGGGETVLETDTAKMGIFVNGIYSGKRQYTFVELRKTFYEGESYLYDESGLKKLDIPSDAEFNGMYGDEILLYLQSDWTAGSGTFTSGSLVSVNLPSLLNGVKKITNIYTPADRSGFVSVMASAGFIVVSTMENVQGRLKIFRFDGKEWVPSDVTVPGFGTVSLIASDRESDDYFFSFSNPVVPNTLYHGKGEKTEALRSQKDYFNAKGLKVDQYEVKSKDGTIIPYFIVYPETMQNNGKNPVLIYGYGGFNIPEQPSYGALRGIGWMEKGGVYVIASIRGGGEFGPSWHQSAMKEKRQNAYDDFIAVSEDIVNRKISSPPYMGVFGWSNGGLLAGVALTQRPDLYNAVVVGAPLLDMKRYSKLLAGASWMGEYGDPDKPEDWAYISSYSPYQNLKEGVKYPQPLFVTSTRDDRVHPGHARKMAAKMEELGIPVYFHETIEGGHGAASTTSQEANMWALIYTYLNEKLMVRE